MLYELYVPVVDKNVFQGKEFSNISEPNNFHQYTPRCDEGWNLWKLIPSVRCGDVFKFAIVENVTNIHIRNDDKYISEYCLQIQDDLTYQASYCKKEPLKYKEM